MVPENNKRIFTIFKKNMSQEHYFKLFILQPEVIIKMQCDTKFSVNLSPVWFYQSKHPLLKKKEILTFPPGDHKDFGPQPSRQNSLRRIYFNIIPFMMSLSFLNVDVVDVTLEDSVLIFFSITFKIVQYLKIHLYVKPSFSLSLL